MSNNEGFLSGLWERLKSWEGFLVVLLLIIVAINSLQSPAYLSVGNQINLFQLSIEKIIVALVMTFVIINGEIDLSVASMMGLSACTLGWLHEQGVLINHVMTKYVYLAASDIFSGPYPFNGFPESTESESKFAFVTCFVAKDRPPSFKGALANKIVEAVEPEISSKYVFVHFRPVDPENFLYGDLASTGKGTFA